MNLYQLKINIPGLKGVYRTITATENCTLDDLHHLIFKAFDKEEQHLYSFFLTKSSTQSMRTIYNSPEFTHPWSTEDPFGDSPPKKSAAKTKIGQLDLAPKDVFYYLFDFGDEWWHRIRVEKITPSDLKRKTIKMVKSVGDSPPQYQQEEDDEGDEESNPDHDVLARIVQPAKLS